MGFGGGMGGFSIGPSSVQANAEAGLPFAELPDDFHERIEKVVEKEPEHPDPQISFSHSKWDRSPFTLKAFLSSHSLMLCLALLLVVLESGLQHLGPLLTQIAIDDGVASKNTQILIVTCICYVISIALSAGISFARASFTGRLGEKLVYKLRIRVFSHLQRQSFSFFTNEKAGVLMTRMTSDIESLTVLFQEGLVNFAVQIVTLIVITIYLIVLNPYLALITLLLVVPVNIILTLWFRKVSIFGYLNVRDKIAAILSNLSESLAGMRVITAFNQRKNRSKLHDETTVAHFEANIFTGRAQAIFGPGTEAVGIVTQAIVLLIGGKMVLNGDLSIGELTAFLLFLTSFFAPIQSLVQLYNQYQQGSASIEKLRELLSTAPSVPEKENAVEIKEVIGHIELKSINFSYEKNKPILKDVSLVVEPGEVIALVGPTGAGKSTIAKLISRFYDPDEGELLVDGYDLRDVQIESLRKQIAVVPQEPFLFNGSIKENVIFARPFANEKDIEEACDAVGLTGLISRLPNGIDSAIHERGASLSAGERQLLALARAFLCQPRLLILDEATSNLDLLSESSIERALDNLLEGRTSIIVAHRIATAMKADRIAVVDDGSIIEIGTHEELVQLSGKYSSMYKTWAQQGGKEFDSQ
tara:strand:- start:954 stop:2882 length:1929 start_codon:yes stop_codon:yes gene_type:complete